MSNELNNEIISSMEETLAYATKKADQAELILGRSESFSLSADQGKIDKYQVSNARSVGVRLIKGNQVGISYTENINKESLEEMVDLALVNSTQMKEDPFQKIITQKEKKELINTHEKNYAEDSTETQDKIDLCLSLESSVKALDTRIKGAPYNGYGESTGERYILNTEGLLSYERSRSFSCYTSCLMEEGSKNGMHYKGMSGRTFRELDCDQVVQASYKIAKGLYEGVPLETGKYDVVFTADCLQDFLGSFSVIYSGKSTAEGKNPFKDKIGTQVFSSAISIYDRPQFSEASFYHLFDDEGMEMDDLSLIKDGVLQNFYHNSATPMSLNLKTIVAPQGQVKVSSALEEQRKL